MPEREPRATQSTESTPPRWRSSSLAWVLVLVGIGLLVVAAGFWQTQVTLPNGNWCGSVRTHLTDRFGGVRADGLGAQADPGCTGALDDRRAWTLVVLGLGVVALALAVVVAVGIPRRAAPLPEEWPARNDSDVLRR